MMLSGEVGFWRKGWDRAKAADGRMERMWDKAVGGSGCWCWYCYYACDDGCCGCYDGYCYRKGRRTGQAEEGDTGMSLKEEARASLC